MITPNYCQLMANYNQRMNQSLYGLCANVPEQTMTKDLGLFFHSIQRTLDHILYGDMSWLLRFEGKENEVPDIDEPLHRNFASLQAARIEWDTKILAWASSVDEVWLASDFSYNSKVDGKTRRRKSWLLACHMFNHQTHHRGQITTALTQQGYDVGITDMPFLVDI